MLRWLRRKSGLDASGNVEPVGVVLLYPHLLLLVLLLLVLLPLRLLHPLHGSPPNLDRNLSPVAEGLGNLSPPIFFCTEINDDLVLLLAIRSLVDGRVDSVEPPKGG